MVNAIQEQYDLEDFIESLENMVEKVNMKAYGPISIHMEGDNDYKQMTVMIKKDRLIITTGRGIDKRKYRIFKDTTNGLQ